MDIKTGTKLDHERYGEGVVSESSLSGFTVLFKRGGEMNFSRLTDEFEILEEGEGEVAQADGAAVSEVKKSLEKTRFGYGRLYWKLYNDLDICFRYPDGSLKTGCGTIFHSFPNWRYAKLLESIILDCYEQMEEYDL